MVEKRRNSRRQLSRLQDAGREVRVGSDTEIVGVGADEPLVSVEI